MPPAPELTDVVDQRAGITDAKSSSGIDARKRVFWTRLVGVASVVLAKNFDQIVFWVLLGAKPAVILTRLENNGVPSVLPALVLRPVTIPFGPIEGLMVVPEATDINVGIA